MVAKAKKVNGAETNGKPSKPAKPSVFQRAVTVAKEAGPVVGNGTTWLLPEAENDNLKNLLRLKREAAAMEADIKTHSAALRDFADTKLCESVVKYGALPATPVKLKGAAGEMTYVTQDRASSCNVTPEQEEGIVALLGEKAAGLIEEKQTFAFRMEALENPAAAEIVALALDAATDVLRAKGLLPKDKEGNEVDLLEAKVVKRFVPAMLDKMPTLCGLDADRMEIYLAALGSAATRFLR